MIDRAPFVRTGDRLDEDRDRRLPKLDAIARDQIYLPLTSRESRFDDTSSSFCKYPTCCTSTPPRLQPFAPDSANLFT
jgi:hypothetical protein